MRNCFHKADVHLQMLTMCCAFVRMCCQRIWISEAHSARKHDCLSRSTCVLKPLLFFFCFTVCRSFREAP